MGSWHRRSTGVYVRARSGNVLDRVSRVAGGKWIAEIVTPEKRIGTGKRFPTRLAATSALDGYIRTRPVEMREQVAETPVPETPKPETDKCDSCNGSGTYYGAGSIVNGVFKGFTGPCFRCDGKGTQTKADHKRNRYYDNHVRRIYL